MEIQTNINPKKAPGFDFITMDILKMLQEKTIVKIANLINACFRHKYVTKM